MPKENKLLAALKSLSRKEMTYYCEYVHSPFFNKHEKLKKFASILSESYSELDELFADRKQLFKKVFPEEKKFSEQKFFDHCTYMLRLFDDFLAHNKVFDDAALKKELTLKEYLSKKLIKQLPAKLDKHKLQIEKQISVTDDTFRQLSATHDLFDQYHFAVDARSRNAHLQEKSDSLDTHFILQKLKTACEMINRSNIVKVDFKTAFIENIIKWIEEDERLKNIPAIAIYYSIYKTLTEPEKTSNYNQLIKLLDEHATSFSPQEARVMFEYAKNYCIKKINSGNSDYLREIFSIYQKLLDTKIIFDQNNLITEWDYKNIVTVGTRINEKKWTEKFIHRLKDSMSKDVRENAFRYNLASFYYANRNFKKAIEILRDVEFTDVYYQLGARSLLLKAYYEAEEFQPLQSLIESFKMYLHRNKAVSGYQKIVHHNLLRMTNHLLKLKMNFEFSGKEQNQKRMKRIHALIEKDKRITNLDWLMGELKKTEAQF